MLTRRDAMRGLLCATAAMACPSIATAAQPDWRAQVLMRDRILTLKRPASGESFSLCYWRPSHGWDMQGYAAACHLLRDVKYKQSARMDTRLLDALYIMQTWLAAYGKPHGINILSGYRTPEHNGSLEGAAKDSMHIKGRAADIHIPGMSTAVLASMGSMIGAGGVGVYPSRGFIHIDTGPIRSWRG